MFKKLKEQELQYDRQLQQLQGRGFVVEKSYFSYDDINSDYPCLLFDFTHNQCAFNFQVFTLDKVVEVELVQDGTVVHKNAVAPAMVGAAVFGLAGAVAGATAMHTDAQVGLLAVRVLLDDPRMPSIFVPFLKASIDKKSSIYLKVFQRAQEVYGIFEGIVGYNERNLQKAVYQPVVSNPQVSAAAGYCSACGSALANDAMFCSRCGKPVERFSAKGMEQLQKLEQLRDEGILTAEEFTAKKRLLS